MRVGQGLGVRLESIKGEGFLGLLLLLGKRGLMLIPITGPGSNQVFPASGNYLLNTGDTSPERSGPLDMWERISLVSPTAYLFPRGSAVVLCKASQSLSVLPVTDSILGYCLSVRKASVIWIYTSPSNSERSRQAREKGKRGTSDDRKRKRASKGWT